ncbi:MAG: hypothetical protein LBO70_00245 [Clostridiales Family XIII bacterium]|jgi:hypothetical protein|nr:hypothetical protein [Clostridiales Family XIII bacterium]
MTLVLTLVAAIVVTVLRFAKPDIAVRNKLGLLALFYWGASVMWCVDGFASLAEGEAFIEISGKAAMADDALLGMCVVLLGLVVWAVCKAVAHFSDRSRAQH